MTESNIRRMAREEARAVIEEEFLDAFFAYLDAQDAASMSFRQFFKKRIPEDKSTNIVTVPEQTFNVLKFEGHKSEKLKDFEVADRKSNVEQNWIHAFNILKSANATIDSRYHGSEYVFSYWLYQDRVFRQRLKS